jgi:predicted nucleic acid-binding protein
VILTDTSVVIAHSRAKDHKLLALIPTLTLGVCGVTRAQVLSGPRPPAVRAKLVAVLAQYASIPIPEAVWDDVGDNYVLLRANGVTPEFADLVIATVAIHFDIELWSRDNDFRLMQPHLPSLRLFVEPP